MAAAPTVPHPAGEPAPHATDGATDGPATPPAGAGRSLGYHAGLDGLRAFAVIAVLCFHNGFSWAIGGYLGVSTFFTLSGFLITSLLLAEADTTGRIRLGNFWRRRFRRLMPAALLGLILASAVTLAVGDAVQARDLPGDVLAALLDVANWRFILEGQSYADLFAAPSAVLHYWSLAIEEQFYLLFPLVVAALVGVTRRRGGRSGNLLGAVGAPADATRHRRLTWGLLALTAASVILASAGWFSDNTVYLATPTRAAELLVGALLAIWLRRPRVAHFLRTDATARLAATTAGAGALVIIVFLLTSTPQSSWWLYRGGFAAYALLSALVILACVTPTPLARALGVAPLRVIGLVSYGLYVVHWPVFLLLSPARQIDVGPVSLTLPSNEWKIFAVRLAATAAIAIPSYFLLERPIRHTGRLPAGAGPLSRTPAIRLAPLPLAILMVLVLATTVSAPEPEVNIAAAEQAARDAAAAAEARGDALPPGDAPAAGEVPYVAVYGDSTALTMSTGLNDWMTRTGLGAYASGSTSLGCALGRGGRWRVGATEGDLGPGFCEPFDVAWARERTLNHPDVIALLVGPWDIADRQLEGSDSWTHIGEEDYDQWLLGEMLAAADVLTADGAELMWLTSPPVFRPPEEHDPRTVARMERFNDLIGEVAKARPDQVHVIDMAEWLAANDPDDGLRDDGIHLNDDGSRAVADEFLGQAIIDTYRADRGFPPAD